MLARLKFVADHSYCALAAPAGPPATFNSAHPDRPRDDNRGYRESTSQVSASAPLWNHKNIYVQNLAPATNVNSGRGQTSPLANGVGRAYPGSLESRRGPNDNSNRRFDGPPGNYLQNVPQGPSQNGNRSYDKPPLGDKKERTGGKYRQV